MTTYSLQEIRNGTGWPRGARFMCVRDEEGRRAYLADGPDNTDRATWARIALEAFGHRTRQLPSDDSLAGEDWTDPDLGMEILGDLLGDIIHLVGEDVFETALERGRGYYLEELAEEEE